MERTIKNPTIFLLFIGLIVLVNSCKKDKGSPAILTTTNVSEFTQTSALSGGNITADGGTAITARGVCWSTTQNPSIADSKTSNGSGPGVFTSYITGLTVNTTYYVKAYASNSAGTAYGNQVNFATNPAILPVLTTVAVTAVTQTTALCGGNITADGGGAITARGVCWSITRNPKVSDSKTTDGSGPGTFTSYITGLLLNTIYYVRAYATNSAGTAYGDEINFLTNPSTLPALTTSEATSITQTSAISGGSITADGGAAVTNRGVCWSATQNPTTANNKTSDGIGMGTFTSYITGLSLNTTYYVRAYATNSAGTAYGNQISFKANPAILPVLTTVEVTSITQTSALTGGDVTTDGGVLITARGVCWSTTQFPTTADSTTTDGSGLGTFTSYITRLVLNTTYYVRAYATNSVGTGYGNEISFKTNPATFPVLSTSAATAITQTSALSGGTITADGGGTITARGVCWSPTQNPTIDNNKTADGSGLGTFTSYITGLTLNTTYYVRAYATNSAGTSYGNEINFTSNPPTLPVLTTFDATSITQTTAISGGSISADGGATVTVRGVCWSTTHSPTIADSKTADGSGLGIYSSYITALVLNTTYYVRAYATNNVGTAYGDEVSFTTTPATLPVLSTVAATAITQTAALSGGSITADGGGTITARGVCWSTTQNPTTVNNKTTDGSGPGMFTSYITGLTLNTTYYARAYAVNSAGTAYGNQISFTTNPATLSVLTTVPVTSITQTTAVSGGSITSDGGGTITARGVCWSTAQNPTIANSKTTDGTGLGTFSSYITGLALNTTYYLRAYATNSAGTAYGNEIGFTTNPATLPVLTTVAATSITQTTALSGGSITSDGGASVTARGVCWSITQFPTTANSKTTDGSGQGVFTSYLTGLTLNTTYYVRAYAVNSAGTAYGNQISFTTNPAMLPGLTTVAATSITQTTAVSGGTITADGGASITARGVCWSITQNPTTANNKTTDGSGPGAFTSYLTGLDLNTTYYVRAYATNSAGTGYGNEISFTTNPATLPVLTTATATSITQTTALSGGSITADGGASITARGVCWSTSQNPTTANNKTTDGFGPGAYTSYMTGLALGTIYYVRAYATNVAGTAYGNEISFTTNPATLPVLTTVAATSITQTTAVSGGSITADGGASVTARGACWSTTQNPTTADSTTADGTGQGTFTSFLTGLVSGTTYYVRAYAINSAGTAYGDQISFTTN